MMKKIFCIFLIAVTTYASSAQADCMGIQGKNAIEHVDLIFKGKSIKTSPYWLSYFTLQRFNYYTTFTVEEVFKGKPAKQIDIFYRYSSRGRPTVFPIPVGEESIVFVNIDSKTGEYTLSACFENRMNMRNIESEKLSDQTKLTLIALVDGFPNIQDVNFVNLIRSIEKKFVRETLAGHLFRQLLQSGREKELESQLDEYEKNPQKFLCTNIGWAEAVFKNYLEKDVSCK